MKMMLGHVWRFILIVLVGSIGSMISGLILYGAEIVNPLSPGYYFIVYGLSTSILFGCYHIWGLGRTIIAALAVSTLFFIVIAVTFHMPILHSVFWAFGINMPVVVLVFLFERKLVYFKQWKFLVVGIMYGAVFVFISGLVGLITRVSSMPPEYFQKNFVDGLALGIGLGIGVEIAESLIHSVDLHLEARRGNKK